ncbi:MAG: DUF58 domain-containing protein [Planctomycetes bacterium]|nr:DUF58 domain-containing protein [Planctomycetota bacterium]
MSALFPEDFLAALEHLRIEARQVVRGGRLAEHHAREAGGGIEFRDYRAYVPGDDFRRVDWNLYRRFARVFLRLRDEVRDLPLHVLLDQSDSMWLESPPRADAARRAAAVMAAASLNQLDPVAVHPFGERLGPALGPVRGKRNLHRVLGFLEAQVPLGRTDIGASLAEFGRAPHRPALAVVISDFFDDRGLEAVVKALGALRHRLVLIRVLRPADREPVLAGEFRLADCETDQTLDVSVSEAVQARYRESYRAFEEGIRSFALARGAALLELDADAPTLPQFGVLFPEGVCRP